MKNQFKKILFVTVLGLILSLSIYSIVLATDNDIHEIEAEYSEEYKEWLELSDEEKQEILMPEKYVIEDYSIEITNPLKLTNIEEISNIERFSLQDVIGPTDYDNINNVKIREQGSTYACWAFGSIGALESSLALKDYYNGFARKQYDFSERHMVYATRRTFLNDEKNPIGYRASLTGGGIFKYAQTYWTNGTGSIPESEMPYNDENLYTIEQIELSEIKGKTVTTKVSEVKDFPTYYASTITEEEINEIKYHIKNYGGLYCAMYYSNDYLNYVEKDNVAHYKNTTGTNHAVTIIGWDDNYDRTNFYSSGQTKTKPTNNGAWIAKNSFGEDSSDTIIYMSYECADIYSGLYGITEASTNIDYENIYQHDIFGPTTLCYVASNKVYLASEFEKQTEETEYLTQVSICAAETSTVKVYVNPEGTSKAPENLLEVTLKPGESEITLVGYNTLEILNPVEITGNEFVVILEIQTEGTETDFYEEIKNEDADYSNEWYVDNSGKSYYYYGNDVLDGTETWKSPAGDFTIKAFTTSTIVDNSLKEIVITTIPETDTYLEGEAFDETGMVVTAVFNNGVYRELVAKDSERNGYEIINGEVLKIGQPVTVSYTYEGVTATVEVPITIEENSAVSLTITTPPTNTEYYEGENFDETGMVVEATFKDESTAIIEDYTIENGENLQYGQETVTISYDEATVEQEITVKENPVVKIEITTPPSTTTYIEGQEFDKTGMVVIATHENEAEEEITEYEILDGESLEVGQTEVTIRYKGQTATQSITVEANGVVKIEITNPPSTTAYIEGQDFDNTGMEVMATDKLENTKIVTDYEVVDGESLEVGQTSVTIRYEGQETTQAMTVEANGIVKIEITTPPSTTAYIEGQDFDKTGMIVIATDKLGDTKTVTDYEIVDGEDLEVGQTSVTIRYEGQTTTQSITVEANTLQKIKITTPPNTTAYIAGQDFDKTGMVVKAVYKDKSEKEITEYEITNGEDLKEGQESVTITYAGQTTTQSITVEKNTLQKIEIAQEPKKTAYIEGQNFDTTNMKVKATYKDKSWVYVTDYEVVDGQNLELGQTSVTITYAGKTVTQSITVEANTLQKIEITQEPRTTEYIEGQNFDDTGMVVKATYKIGTKTITDYKIENGENLKLGQETVTISFEDKKVTQAIKVKENIVVSIELQQKPSKTTYVQNKEELDLTGGTILVKYLNGTTEVVKMTSEEVTVKGFTNKELGKVTVTLTYKTKTIEFEVEIIEGDKAKNTDFENAECEVPKVEAYYFTDDSKEGYVLMQIEINNIERVLSNDSCEYYYYLSADKTEENITNWVKITEQQKIRNKLEFTIDTTDIKNYDEISNADTVYLYIKEVATKGEDQKTVISKSMLVKADNEIETYLDGEKQDSNNTDDTEGKDDTILPGILPETGVGITVMIFMIAVATIGIIQYAKYRRINKKMK